MLKRKYLLLTVLLLILSFSTFAQGTNKDTSEVIIPLRLSIAKEIIKDLERYDLCQIELESLSRKNKLLNKKLFIKDSILVEKDKNIRDYRGKISIKNEQIVTINQKASKYKDNMNTYNTHRKILAGISGILLIIVVL